jgi:hypothetical protein
VAVASRVSWARRIRFSGVGPFILDAPSYKNVLQTLERLKASKS